MPRRTLVDDYPHKMGGHSGSGAMRDLLHWHGLGWDGPPDEGLVFALGGALGLSYLRSSDLVPPLYLVGRGADFEIDLPRRLGAQVQVLTTDDPREGGHGFSTSSKQADPAWYGEISVSCRTSASSSR